MIDDFRGGRQPSRYDAGPRRQLQYIGRSPRLTPVSTQDQDEADAIAIAFDDPSWNAADLPSPMVNPLFGKSGDDSDPDGSDDPSSSDDSGDDDKKKGKGYKNTGKEPGERWYRRLAGKLTRKQWIIVGAVFVAVSGACTAAFILTAPDKPVEDKPAAAAKPVPKPVPPAPPTSPLTGMEVSAEDAKRIVTAVMIENSTNARPQSGLDEAGIVYEAIAEYGITRFMALYQEAKPENIGPVRSVRPYYIDWSKAYDAPIAHVGGSPEALNKIKAEGVKDLDQFFNSPYYRRVNSRFAPHNVYTTMKNLNDAAATKGWTTSTFTGWPRKKPEPAKQVTAQSIDFAISGPTYNVHYNYDPSVNGYRREMAGGGHFDADTKNQITPKVVIGLVASYGLEADGYHSKYQVTGTGEAFIFQDGTSTKVTWKRDNTTSPYQFIDATGKTVKLNPGQTWVTVVGSAGAVTFAGAPATP